MNNLALVLGVQGKYEEVERMYRQDSGTDEKMLGQEHPDIPMSMNNLGDVLRRRAKYEQAEETHRPVTLR